MRKVFSAAAAVALLAGFASTAQAGISINGISINGMQLNGISINGISINGISINGVAASSASEGKVLAIELPAGFQGR